MPADEVVGIIWDEDEGETGSRVTTVPGSIDRWVGFAGLHVPHSDIPSRTIRERRVAGRGAADAVVFIVADSEQHAVVDGVDGRQAQGCQAAIDATAVRGLQPGEETARGIVEGLAATYGESGQGSAAIEPPAVPAFPKIGRA